MRSSAQTLSGTRRRAEDRTVLWGVVVSLILHLWGLKALLSATPSVRIAAPRAIEVSFEAPQRKEQIVSPPDVPESQEAPDTNQLSDKNFKTDQEMIRRGLPASGATRLSNEQADAERASKPPSDPPAPAKVLPKEPPSEKTQPKPQPKSARPEREDTSQAEVSLNQRSPSDKAPKKEPPSDPRLTPLRLNREALMNTFGGATQRKPAPDLAPRPQPFSRAPGAGAAFFGSGGTPDYLPSLPDGDMTMLNAKASKYATFVRRVAVQVFAALRTQGWESLSGGEINSAGGSTLARAVLNPKGDLVSVEIITRSGSGGFDAVVNSSIRSGARDPNPPPDAAADDGTYRFIFEARSWAVRASDPRTGAPSERRWLMLGTGLE